MTRLDSRAAITCHEFLHKQFAPNTFPGLTPDDPDPVVEEFKNQGLLHEQKAIAKVRELVTGFIQIDQKQGRASIQSETARALLDPDVSVIAGGYISEVAEEELAKAFGVVYVPHDRASKPDLMIRVGRRSDGKPAWAPVDIKSHAAIDENRSNWVFASPLSELFPNQSQRSEGRLQLDDLHQLAHYTRHFQHLGIEGDDLWVGVIGRDLENCVWSRIGDVVTGRGKGQESFLSMHDEKFAKAREVVELSIIENANPEKPSGVIPVNSSGKMGCPACKFKSTCLKSMRDFDGGHGHVTLLARITPLVMERNFPDVSSVRELIESPATNDVMVTAKVRARVWQTKTPELIDPSVPLEIPVADVEIDIDLENSMEALQELEIDEPIGEDRLYLYGFGIHDRTISKDWRTAKIDTYSDYSNTEEGEFSVMSKMWNRLQTEIKKAETAGKTIKIFHYSSHEYTWWKRFTERFVGRPGVPSLAELEDFRISYLIDLYPIAQRISFPTMSYSIKDLAPLVNFEWSVDKAGGANSLLKYRDAINPNLDQNLRDDAIAWLDSYNRDDVRATFAVRDYIRGLFSHGDCE
jgi:predicted RecB family nuclease